MVATMFQLLTASLLRVTGSTVPGAALQRLILSSLSNSSLKNISECWLKSISWRVLVSEK